MNKTELINTTKTQARELLKALQRGSEQTYWYENRVKLLKSIINEDLDKFVQFEVIRHTMYVHNTDYVQKEFNELKFNLKYLNAIKENEVGSPLLAKFYPDSSENLIHHAYHVHKFEATSKKDVSNFTSILEFGGGFGSMCRLIKNLGFKGNYTIFDLPEFVLLQKYFLRSIGYTVSDTVEEHKKHPNSILCTSNLKELDPNYDLFLATWSISETSLEFRKTIFSSYKFNNYLIAYQDDFFGVKNTDYFASFKQETPINWESWKIPHLYGGQFYLMGWE